MSNEIKYVSDVRLSVIGCLLSITVMFYSIESTFTSLLVLGSSRGKAAFKEISEFAFSLSRLSNFCSDSVAVFVCQLQFPIKSLRSPLEVDKQANGLLFRGADSLIFQLCCRCNRSFPRIMSRQNSNAVGDTGHRSYCKMPSSSLTRMFHIKSIPGWPAEITLSTDRSEGYWRSRCHKRQMFRTVPDYDFLQTRA